MSYEEFRDQIAGVLRQHRDGMTWTQIRESLNLTQKVPNNRWVHQMENDIGLLRVQDAHGTIIWQLGTKTTGKEKQS